MPVRHELPRAEAERIAGICIGAKHSSELQEEVVAYYYPKCRRIADKFKAIPGFTTEDIDGIIRYMIIRAVRDFDPEKLSKRVHPGSYIMLRVRGELLETCRRVAGREGNNRYRYRRGEPEIITEQWESYLDDDLTDPRDFKELENTLDRLHLNRIVRLMREYLECRALKIFLLLLSEPTLTPRKLRARTGYSLTEIELLREQIRSVALRLHIEL